MTTNGERPSSEFSYVEIAVARAEGRFRVDDSHLGWITPRATDRCVCGHVYSVHGMRGDVLACSVVSCACGPGCIHEGWVAWDARPGDERAASRGQAIAFLRSLAAGSDGVTIYQDVIDHILAEVDELRAELKAVRAANGDINAALARKANDLQVERDAARRDLEGTEGTAALTVAALDEQAKSARSLREVLAEARIEYDALPEHVRAVIRQGAAMRRLLDERLYGDKR